MTALSVSRGGIEERRKLARSHTRCHALLARVVYDIVAYTTRITSGGARRSEATPCASRAGGTTGRARATPISSLLANSFSRNVILTIARKGLLTATPPRARAWRGRCAAARARRSAPSASRRLPAPRGGSTARRTSRGTTRNPVRLFRACARRTRREASLPMSAAWSP